MNDVSRTRGRRESIRRSGAKEVISENQIDRLKKMHWGFYVLIAGAVWAVVEFVMSVMYFFN